MLFVAVTQIEALQDLPKEVEAVELRLDQFKELDLEKIKRVMVHVSYPLLFTLRKRSQGGHFEGSEIEREAVIEAFLKLEPPFFDLEYDTSADFLKKVFQNYPKTQFILSYHNFQLTPPHLEDIYQAMARYPAYSYKVATFVHSTNEALSLLLFARKHPRVSAIGMGPEGEITRILGPVVGNLLNYCVLKEGEETAPGQLTLRDLIEIYNYPTLSPQTKLYGLIGDPVSKSRGAIYHNKLFREKRSDSLYVKMRVTDHELPSFFSLSKKLGFKGLSVTMPLKEAVMPFLDQIDQEAEQIEAVNTILFKNDKLYGFNTDGKGALDAIEKKESVKGKKVILIGAGGSAKAIAFEAIKRSAHLLILNRTVKKALALAHQLGCQGGSLGDIPSNYDILINTSAAPMPIDPAKLLPSALIMDIIYVPRETTFLSHALSLGCRVVYGDEMFYNQADAQNTLWLENPN